MTSLLWPEQKLNQSFSYSKNPLSGNTARLTGFHCAWPCQHSFINLVIGKIVNVRLPVSHFVRQSFRPWTRSTYSPLLYFGYPTRHPKKAHVSCLPVLETVLQKRDIPSARQVNSSCTLKAWDWPVPVTPWKIFRGENAASRQACIKTGLTLATLQTGNLASEGNFTGLFGYVVLGGLQLYAIIHSGPFRCRMGCQHFCDEANNGNSYNTLYFYTMLVKVRMS